MYALSIFDKFRQIPDVKHVISNSDLKKPHTSD